RVLFRSSSCFLGSRLLGRCFLHCSLFSRRFSRCFLGGRFAPWLLWTRLELKADLAVCLAYQEGLELAVGTRGHETIQQVRLAFAQQLGHLLAGNFLLQDHLAATEVAALGGAHRLLAQVTQAVLKDGRLALGAGADR